MNRRHPTRVLAWAQEAQAKFLTKSLGEEFGAEFRRQLGLPPAGAAKSIGVPETVLAQAARNAREGETE